MERKLAVILVADIVGYSAQMERDEAGTHARVTARRRQIFEPAIARHQGRIFKLVGDGLLAEFGSAVQAVECAIALQASLAERNYDVPTEQRIFVRIGINLGEVIVDGEDRFGEGVNIAARLEQLAEPGGICVSEKVAREVERKLAFGFESMGVKRVKNIAEPIHVYRVSGDASQGPRRNATNPRSNKRLLIIFSGLIAIVVSAAVWLGRPTVPVEPSAGVGTPVSKPTSDEALSAAPARWAAVAVNSSTGMYGIAANDQTRASAESRAFEFCRGFSDERPGCRIVLSTSACGAVAIGNGEFFATEATGVNAAGILALAQCQAKHGASCVLDNSFCALD